jgi:hypothetical protein
MGVGYILGCFCSILLWKIDRSIIAARINTWFRKAIKQDILLQFLYLALILAVVVMLESVSRNELYNFITAVLVIDVSNSERKNLNVGERTHFYDSISLISRSLVCGFIAPLFFILILGNNFAIMYMIIYNLNAVDDFTIFKAAFTVLSIIPSFFTQVILYIVYLFRNKRLYIDFKGDYIINSFTRPLLNLDILGAYIESVNFYYYYNNRDMHYIKSYGEYTNKIDNMCVKDYLSISYGICLLCFVLFFLFLRVV